MPSHPHSYSHIQPHTDFPTLYDFRDYLKQQQAEEEAHKRAEAALAAKRAAESAKAKAAAAVAAAKRQIQLSRELAHNAHEAAAWNGDEDEQREVREGIEVKQDVARNDGTSHVTAGKTNKKANKLLNWYEVAQKRAVKDKQKLREKEREEALKLSRARQAQRGNVLGNLAAGIR